MRSFKKFLLLKYCKLYRAYLKYKWVRFITWFFVYYWMLNPLNGKHYFHLILRIILVLFYRHFFIFPMYKRKVVNTVLGPPGSGKTSFAAFWALKCKYMHEPVYCNVPIVDTIDFSWEDDFGHYVIENATIIIDEAGLELDNRNFALNFADVVDKKTGKLIHNGKQKLETAKLHRHYGLDILLLSQWTDQDLKLRNLSQNYWVMRKTGFPWLLHAKLYDTDIDVDQMTGDFRMIRIKKHSYFIFSPVIWFDFITDEHPVLPEKDHWRVRSSHAAE